jgi:cytochrome P450
MMPSILFIVISVLLIYLSSLVYRLLGNLLKARKAGFPYIIIPWDQNSVFWMIASPALQPWLAKNMPKWVWDRLSLTIFGFEFRERLRPYEQYAAPQGNDLSYVIVTPGIFEVSTRDPEIASEVLRRTKDFVVPELNKLFMEKFGPNILTTDGDVWSKHRKLVSGVINERISEAVFRESIHQTEGLLDEVLENSEAGVTNRMFDMMRKITINVSFSISLKKKKSFPLPHVW